jgi:hypothetical protein
MRTEPGERDCCVDDPSSASCRGFPTEVFEQGVSLPDSGVPYVEFILAADDSNAPLGHAGRAPED